MSIMAADDGLTVEWTFADTAMARFNPLGWTAAENLEAAISQMEGLAGEDATRPIFLKMPAGVWTPSEQFDNARAAKQHLHRALRKTTSFVASRPRAASSSSAPGRSHAVGPSAEWMFGDVAKGVFGVHAWAKYNPLRWSRPRSIEEVIAQLNALPTKDIQRPVNVKVPAGALTPEQHFGTSREAVAFLGRKLAQTKKAAVSWAIELTSYLCKRGEEAHFNGREALLLDKDKFWSVQTTVDQLNTDESLCPGGLCIVFSKRTDSYVLVFRADKRHEAKKLFGLGSLSWKEFAQRRDNKEGYRFGDLTRGALRNILGDWTASSGRFDAKKLVVVRSGSLDDRYETLRVLGAGAQGTASLLRRKGTGQEYVAKATDSDEHAVEDLRAELEKMQVLRHPRCTKMVEFLESPQAVTICEFAQQGDLAGYLSKRAPEDGILAGAAGIFKQAMAGVAFLHASGCVHNDLKPENLLVFASRPGKQVPRVAIADFGCARFAVKDPRLKFGDPRYMAPENVRSMQEYLRADDIIDVQFRSSGDVWSTGVILFEMLSKGIIPFLYEECSLERMQKESGLFERLQEGLLAPEEVDFEKFCPGDAPAQLLALLPDLLDKNEYSRPTAQAVMAHLKEAGLQQQNGSEPAVPTERRRVVLSVQQHRAFQILFNCMMWRIQSEHVDDLVDVFERLNTSNSGRISREEFKQALEHFSEDASASGADELFNAADINGDESLEFNEFAAISFDWGSMDEAELDKHIQELLEDLSQTGTGEVTEEELAKFFEQAVDRSELFQLFARIDKERSGKIGAPDLRLFLQKYQDSAHKPVVCNVEIG